MRRGRDLSLDLFGDRLGAVRQRDDGWEHRRLLAAMKNAAEGELTGRQRECLRMRYGEQLPVKEIAAALGVAPSTVSRHLKRATNRLRSVLRYYYTKL